MGVLRMARAQIAKKAVEKEKTLKDDEKENDHHDENHANDDKAKLFAADGHSHKSMQLIEAAEESLRNDILHGGISGKGRDAMKEMLNEMGLEGQMGPANFTQTPWFHGLIATTILVNAVTMGVETDYPQHKAVYDVLEHIFTGIYTVEMVAKLYYYRLLYFKDGWNLSDFFLVWMSIVDVWIIGALEGGGDTQMQDFAALRVLRIIRVIRMVRLLKVFRDLWLLIKGMLDSVITIFWASLLVIMLLYVGGLFCVETIGKSGLYREQILEVEPGVEVDYHPDFDSYQFFGNVPRAMFTLFETCLEPLNIRPIVEKQPELFPFFLIYIFLTTFGVMNVIIGVIVENTMEANNQTEQDIKDVERDEKCKKIEQIRDACFLFDENGDGFITMEELKKGLSQPAISECLKDLVFPVGGDEEELFQLLDAGGNGEITHEKMLRGLFRAISSKERAHILEIKAEIHRMQRMVRAVGESKDTTSDRLKNVEGTVKDRLGQIRNQNQALRGTLRDIAILGMGGEPVPGLMLPAGKKSQKKYFGVWSARDKDNIVPKTAPSSAGSHSSHGRPLIPVREGRSGASVSSRSNSPSSASGTRVSKGDSMRTPPGLGSLIGAADVGGGKNYSTPRDPFANLPQTPRSTPETVPKTPRDPKK